jgi:hypothetical protein
VVDLPVSGPLPEIAVVVPTYWTRAGGTAVAGDAVYDHPTPIDGSGTLTRLLESLTQLDSSRFYVLILAAVTSDEVEPAARARIQAITAGVPALRCLIVSRADVDLVAQGVEGGPAADLLGLTGYSRVRNLQLAVPLALGSSAIVALDDDEVVTDSRFLDEATGLLGSSVEGQTVEGLGGYYLQDQAGRILLEVPPGSENASNIFDRKAAIMNSATERLEATPGRIVPTPFCFGGNMVFSRTLAAAVFFDPSITRGEDIDYLMNARLSGCTYFMNKDLKILHLPPAGGSYKDVAHHKVVQDVLRFIYEREKLACWREIGATRAVTPAELDPYPGQFLGDRLDNDAREIMTRIFGQTSGAEREMLGLGGSVDEFMLAARNRALSGVEKYRSRQSGWRRLTAHLETLRDSREALAERLRAQPVGANQ